MNSVLHQWTNLRRNLQRGLYFVVLLGLAVFLYQLGVSPWHHVVENWIVFCGTTLINCTGIIIQAASYRNVQPPQVKRLPWGVLIRIWSLTGIMSMIAPIVAGMATRTSLLVHAGMPLSLCLTTSIRQMWMGLEYALWLGGVSALLVDPSGFVYLALVLIVAGTMMTSLRVFSGRIRTLAPQRFRKWVDALGMPIAKHAHPWFVAQLVTMSAVYMLAFTGFGAPLGWEEAVLLSAATVVASLVIVIPNGLGMMDAIWVFVAVRSGLELNESAALAIIFRLGYLMAALVVWVAFSIIQSSQHSGE